MNVIEKYLKERKGFLIVSCLTSFVSGFLFNSFVADTEDWLNIFLFIFLPVLVIPLTYLAIERRMTKKTMIPGSTSLYASSIMTIV
jgi:predicted membrane channel-forming protein YqfA (hemolysin III family)